MVKPPSLLWDKVAVHNGAELRDMSEAHGQGAVSPQRVVEAVRGVLNEGAQARMREAAGVELRLVTDGPVELVLSTPEAEAGPLTDAMVFHGRFQHWGGRGDLGTRPRLGREPTVVRVAPPERLTEYAEEVRGVRGAGDFAAAVNRVLLPILAGPVVLHEVRPGAGVTLRPPRRDELPVRRVLFYGTSITHGSAATAPHLTYPQLCTNWLGADAINLGVGGSCHCEAELADDIAAREDWHAAVLALSVNMVGGFDDATFADRVRYFVHTVAGRDQHRPVFAITLWPYFADLRAGEPHDKTARFRQHLRDAVASCPTANAYLVEGPDLLTRFASLSSDLIHPGDPAMIEMSWRLADAIRPHLDALPSA